MLYKALQAVSDLNAKLHDSDGNVVLDSDMRTRKWENVPPAQIEDVKKALRTYTAEKNGQSARLYVTDLVLGGTKLDGIWRGGRVYGNREDSGKFTVFQELHRGFVTSIGSGASISFSEFRIVGGIYGRGYTAPILRLSNVSKTAVDSICNAIRSNATYTNPATYNATLTGTWNLNAVKPTLEENGGYRIDVYIASNALSSTSYSENAMMKAWTERYRNTVQIDAQTWLGEQAALYADDPTTAYFNPDGTAGAYTVPIGYTLDIDNSQDDEGLYSATVVVKEAKQDISTQTTITNTGITIREKVGYNVNSVADFLAGANNFSGLFTTNPYLYDSGVSVTVNEFGLRAIRNTERND